MAERIYISKIEFHQLASMIDRYSEGRDGAAAERLAAELDRAIVVEPGHVPPDVVRMESQVTFEDARSGAVREVVVVFPHEANASAGRISVLAPIGAALLGLRTGDSIEWPLPDARTARIRILAVGEHVDPGSARLSPG
jgi:regulator of nucleoside diphosphate kinase